MADVTSRWNVWFGLFTGYVFMEIWKWMRCWIDLMIVLELKQYYHFNSTALSAHKSYIFFCIWFTIDFKCIYEPLIRGRWFINIIWNQSGEFIFWFLILFLTKPHFQPSLPEKMRMNVRIRIRMRNEKMVYKGDLSPYNFISYLSLVLSTSSSTLSSFLPFSFSAKCELRNANFKSEMWIANFKSEMRIAKANCEFYFAFFLE